MPDAGPRLTVAVTVLLARWAFTFSQAKAAPGLSRPTWLVLGDLLGAMGKQSEFFSQSVAERKRTIEITIDEIGVTVGAVVVVNSAGNIADPSTGLPWMADQILEFGLVPPPADQIAAFAQRDAELSPLNTTIAVVATDAALSPAACRRLAIAAQDALARTIRPSHTPLDGDTVFALATGAVEVPPRADTPAGLSPETAVTTAVGAAAADCLARAAMVGVLAAESIAGIPTYRDMLPGAFG